MKRALIVTGVWVLFTLLVFYAIGPVAEHARETMTGHELRDFQSGLGLFSGVWFLSLPLMGLMWIIVLFRWVLGKPREKRPWVEQIPAAPPPAESPKFTITGRQIR